MMIDSHKKREVRIPDRVIYNNPKCWEIYMAYIPDQPNEDSHVTSGERPVIISSNKKGNRTSTEVNVYTLTKRAPKLPVHVRLYPDGKNGLSVPSTVLIEQPDTISKKFLLKRLGSVDDIMTRYKLQNAVLMQHGFFTEMDSNLQKLE